MEIYRGFGELLAQPANMLCTFSKFLPNNMYKVDSVIYKIC